MLTSDRIPCLKPGQLIAARSELCPDCRAGVRYTGGFPMLVLEHDPTCPMFSAIRRDAAAQTMTTTDEWSIA